MNFPPSLSTALFHYSFFVRKSHGSDREGLGLPRDLGIDFVPMLSMAEALLAAQRSVIVVILPDYHCHQVLIY